MPEHEASAIAQRDSVGSTRHEYRASRAPAVNARGADTDAQEPDDTSPGDAVMAASEAMVLERLPGDAAAPPPPGRQRTGDPPAV